MTKQTYIAAPAYTSSEWDPVSFALIELTPGLLKTLKAAVKVANKTEYPFNEYTIYADNAEFFVGEDLDDEMRVPDGSAFATIVKLLPRTVYEEFTPVEQSIKYGEMRFNKDTKEIKFLGYGKYSDEEFYAFVPFELILKQKNTKP